MVLFILFIILAAICKALVNTIAFHKGGIFHGIKFFDITVQGKFLPYTKYPLDGYHVFNSLMITFFLLAIFGFSWWVIIGGLLFNVTFNLFWNKIFN